ncbi:MAG: EamA family transporter, partial [Burkholderiales bacterium]
MTATHYGYALAGAALLLFSVSVMLTRAATQRVELSTGVLVALFVNVLVGGVLFAADLLLRA